jgi:cysteinyl-tRNA synthetase
LDLLRREPSADGWSSAGHKPTVPVPPPAEAKSFWITVHDLEAAFHAGLEGREPETAMNALLELDQVLWRAQQDLESPEFLSQARETFRELIVRLGSKLEGSPEDEISYWSPLITDLVGLRDRFRQEQKWDEADAIRACLQQANIVVEDTKSGARWRIGM